MEKAVDKAAATADRQTTNHGTARNWQGFSQQRSAADSH
jgi:hypothetical protein